MDQNLRSVLAQRFYQQDPKDIDNAECKRRFGRFMRQWRLRNGWTQYTSGKYADELGFSSISYENLSVLENGTSGELGWRGFWQIGRLNFSFYSREYENHVFADPDLKERFKRISPAPILLEDGLPWLASDFMLSSFGYIEFPWDIDEEDKKIELAAIEPSFTEATALMFLAKRQFSLFTEPFCGGQMQVLRRKAGITLAKDTKLALEVLTASGYSYEYLDKDTGNTCSLLQAYEKND